MALIFAIVRIIVYTRLIGLIKFPIRLRSSKKQPTDSESLHSFGKLFHHRNEEYFFPSNHNQNFSELRQAENIIV